MCYPSATLYCTTGLSLKPWWITPIGINIEPHSLLSWVSCSISKRQMPREIQTLLKKKKKKNCRKTVNSYFQGLTVHIPCMNMVYLFYCLMYVTREINTLNALTKPLWDLFMSQNCTSTPYIYTNDKIQ